MVDVSWKGGLRQGGRWFVRWGLVGPLLSWDGRRVGWCLHVFYVEGGYGEELDNFTFLEAWLG